MQSEENRVRYQEALELQTIGREADAEERYRAILAEEPDNVDALQGLGMILMSLGQGVKARETIEDALRLAPDRIDLQLNIADITQVLGDDAAALGWIERIRAAVPSMPMLDFLLGRHFWKQGEAKRALEHFDRAIAVDPAHAIVFSRWYVDYLRGFDWRAYSELLAFVLARVRSGRPIVHALDLMSVVDSPRDIELAGRGLGKLHPYRGQVWNSAKPSHERIRIGYMTGDLEDHPVAPLLAALLEHHDRTAFDITVFSVGPDRPHSNRERVVAAAEHFEDISGLVDLAAAQTIHARQIDILVTLGGHTLGARPGIAAYRPAPVQVNYMGYPGTMGVSYIDYLVADHHVIRPEEAGRYVEKIAWMPETYQVTDKRSVVNPVRPSRTAEGLPEEAFVFAAFTKAIKITPQLFASWMRILAAVEGSVLWLAQLHPESKGALHRHAEEHGIDPARLIFASYVPDRATHLARHPLADVFLDTFPYNGHTTSADALWMGLPVVTIRGSTFPSRVCGGLLSVAGLPDLVCDSLEGYEQLAIGLAKNPARLAELLVRIEAARTSPLYDTRRYVRHLEAAFRRMHERRLAEMPAEAFSVEAQAPEAVSG